MVRRVRDAGRLPSTPASPGAVADGGRGLEYAETVQALDRAIRGLQAPWREVLAMTVIAGLNSREISLALGIPAATVRYRLMKARQALQEGLLAADHAPQGGVRD